MLLEIPVIYAQKPLKNTEKYYTYVFVRTDIPVSQQIVQSNHAALEAGIFLGNQEQSEPSSLISIAVKNKYQLEKAINYLKSQNVELIEFHEPSWDYGLTAFATEPIHIDSKHIFKRYQLWK